MLRSDVTDTSGISLLAGYMVHGMRKLPPFDGVVHRGVYGDFAKKLKNMPL